MTVQTQSYPNIIISLFDHSGVWSYFYRCAGYIVIQIDTKLGISLSDFNYKSIPKNRVHGVLSAPPCTAFSKAGSCFWSVKDGSGVTKQSVELVLNVLSLIDYFNPHFWALEQPPGRISKLIPYLKSKRLLSYQPYDYGSPYTKYTILYGDFNPFLVQAPVKPLPPVAKGQMSVDNYQIHHLKKTVPRNKQNEFRSITPFEFAKAFYNANP